jgi:hypothetical protein
MTDNDHDVRELFARLKQEDGAHTPPFRKPMRTEANRRSWSPGLAAAAVIALIALVLTRPDAPPLHSSRQLVDLRVSTWRSPTDFLLVTPGSELMRTVPAVGLPRPWIPDWPAPESTRS